MNEVEEKKKILTLEVRGLLSIMDVIDGKSRQYENYTENTLNESEFLDLQIKLVSEVKKRLLDVFRD